MSSSGGAVCHNRINYVSWVPYRLWLQFLGYTYYWIAAAAAATDSVSFGDLLIGVSEKS